MARNPRTLDEVKQHVEQILLSEKLSDYQGRNDPAREQPSAMTDQSSILSAARHLSATCNAMGNDIQKSGKEVAQIAGDLAAEADALAELLRKHGASMANRIEEFTAMTRRLQEAMKLVRADLSSSTGSSPTLLVP